MRWLLAAASCLLPVLPVLLLLLGLLLPSELLPPLLLLLFFEFNTWQTKAIPHARNLGRCWFKVFFLLPLGGEDVSDP